MHRATGFSLMELMVVVAVIAILSAIGYPAYTDYVRRSQLTEAFTNLSDFRMRMEQYFQDNRTYANAGACGAADPATPNPKFGYGCVTDGNTYTMTATGNVGHVNGFVFTINHRNVRATTGLYAEWGALPGDAGTRWVDRKP